MMRISLAIVTLAVLALPPLAPAKEVTSMQVCGVSGCAAIAKVKARIFFAHPDEQATATGIPAVGPYYALEVGVGDGIEVHATVAAYALASGRASRTMEGSWTALTPAQRDALASAGVSRRRQALPRRDPMPA